MSVAIRTISLSWKLVKILCPTFKTGSTTMYPGYCLASEWGFSVSDSDHKFLQFSPFIPSLDTTNFFSSYNFTHSFISFIFTSLSLSHTFSHTRTFSHSFLSLSLSLPRSLPSYPNTLFHSFTRTLSYSLSISKSKLYSCFVSQSFSALAFFRVYILCLCLLIKLKSMPL